MKHKHRDLWIVLVSVLIVVSASEIVSIPTAKIQGKWETILVASAIFSFLVTAYMCAALIWGLALPGGFEGEYIRDQSDEDLGQECLRMAQRMIDFLSEAKRNQPGYGVEEPLTTSDGGDMHRAWQRSVTRSREYENGSLAKFTERFAVPLSGLLQALIAKNKLTEEEARSLWWSTQTIHWIDKIPQTLASKARELGAVADS